MGSDNLNEEDEAVQPPSAALLRQASGECGDVELLGLHLPPASKTNHLVFSGLPDPADVIIVLLSDAISRVGADFLKDAGGDVVSFSQIFGVAGCAHPAERAKAQGEDVAAEEAGVRSFFQDVFHKYNKATAPAHQ